MELGTDIPIAGKTVEYGCSLFFVEEMACLVIVCLCRIPELVRDVICMFGFSNQSKSNSEVVMPSSSQKRKKELYQDPDINTLSPFPMLLTAAMRPSSNIA